PERLAANIARYEAHGVSGYLVLGSTGEAALLDEAEKVALLGAAREAVPRSKILIAGVGLESTAATVRLARRAAELGADAVLVLTPHFYRERMTGAALERHYCAVADGSPVPVLLYSVPKFTGLAIEPLTAIRLSSHENVAGIKDSEASIAGMLEVLEGATRGFRVLSGHAGACRSALAAGASGAILAAAAALPEPFVAIAKLVAENRQPEAAALQRRIAGPARLIASTHGIPGLKCAIDLRGLNGGAPRSPLRPLDERARRAVERCLDRLVADGLIPRLSL
ncbi:MAG: dihydrodipicolinate synthase family protein, partial [Acidobacteriota bacterium]|nr:dihydrodipicolinate synthase family protein [Acidobacteriota bacterium]